MTRTDAEAMVHGVNRTQHRIIRAGNAGRPVFLGHAVWTAVVSDRYGVFEYQLGMGNPAMAPTELNHSATGATSSSATPPTVREIPVYNSDPGLGSLRDGRLQELLARVEATQQDARHHQKRPARRIFHTHIFLDKLFTACCRHTRSPTLITEVTSRMQSDTL